LSLVDPLARKAQKGLAQRAANARARERGEPLPYPNLWDTLDPTKLDGEPTHEALLASVAAFRGRWRKKTSSL
jgi:hypothetical protein